MKPGSATLVVLVPALVCVAVQALPTGHKTGGHVPDEVEQLDQLRKVAGLKGAKVVEKESSHMVSADGKVRASSTKEKTVKDAQTDSTLASVKQSSQLEQVHPGERPHSVSRTQVDVPALGIHETKIEDSNQPPQQQPQQQQRLPVPAEKKNYGLYPWNAEDQDRSDYTPTDLAEYILRTGDEEGVAIAVEELLRQGMMSREEAIVYLQDVKAEMNYIRAQQEKLRKIQELREAISMKKKDELKAQHRLGEGFGPREHPPKAPTKAPQKAPQGKPAEKSPTKAAASKEVAPPSSAPVAKENKAVPAAAHGSDASEKSKAARVDTGRAEVAQKRDSAATNKMGVLERLGEEQRQQQETDGLLRRLRGPSPYDEYTLEEIIYWLAKDMFAHSIVKGDQSAEEALARFANFVETEVSQNKLSGEVEKKVLDIMLAALVDILREFPGPQYSGTNPLPPQRLFPEATENQAAKLANARLRNAAIRLREEKKKTIPAVIKHKELPTAAQKS